VQRLLKDLNHLYTATPALYQRDFDAAGFEWIDHNDAERSVLSFIRHGNDRSLAVVVSNFTPSVQAGYRIGVPEAGVYVERINTDSTHYGGSNVGAPFGEFTAEARPCLGKPYSIELRLPPLATLVLTWQG
jgi:1,4-alpha-glucan branching enzyme